MESRERIEELGGVEGGGPGSDPRESGDRLLSVTRSIERELESLRSVGAEQEARAIEQAERERALLEREGAVEEATAALGRARQTVEEREIALAERDGAVSAAEARTENREQEAAAREAEAAERMRRIESREASVTRAEAESQESGRALEAERNEARALGERLAGQKKVLRDREQTVGEREATCELREAELAALQATVTSGAEAARRIAELEGTAQGIEAEFTQRIEALETKVLRARAEADAAGKDRQMAEAEKSSTEGDLRLEISRRDQALEILQNRLREAVASSERAQAELEAARGAPGADKASDGEAPESSAGMEEFNTRRRARLRRLRGLLEERARKVIRAREALAKRAEELERALQSRAERPDAETDERRRMLEQKMAEAEKTLAMRAALTEQEQTLRVQARRLMARASKGSAGGVAAALCVMLVASLAGGWALAGRFASSVYLARATIGMERTGEAHSPETTDSWMAFHEALAHDPQLVERAAERMRKRGFADLASPAALASRLREDLEVVAGAKGEITLSLRGEGAGRTEAVLDTFTGALVQMGNDARDRRLDRVSAIIARAAAADEAPIVDARPSAFAAFAGGLTGLSMIAWLVVWRSMARRPVSFGLEEIDERASDTTQ